MNRVRIGILVIATSFLVAIATVVAAVTGRPLLMTAALAVAAEAIFWVGVVLLGYSTYKVARAKGWRQVPGELWRMFRTPSTAAHDRRTIV